MKIVVAPDAMKGCLAATEVATAIARGLGAHAVDRVPLSDGGEGFVEVLARARTPHVVRDLFGQNREVAIGQRDNFAIIESAQMCGLSARRDPLTASTFGLGQLIARATRPLVVGLGGTGTVDGGLGVMRALGGRFTSADGREITTPRDLPELARAALPARLDGVRAAADTRAVLADAARVFGPQKGARAADVEVLEAGLNRLADVVDPRGEHRGAHTGAAGGLGFALSAMGAVLESGFALVARALGLRARLLGADLCITAEGTFDETSTSGKLVGELAALCAELEVPCVVLAGRVRAKSALTVVDLGGDIASARADLERAARSLI